MMQFSKRLLDCAKRNTIGMEGIELFDRIEITLHYLLLSDRDLNETQPLKQFTQHLLSIPLKVQLFFPKPIFKKRKLLSLKNLRIQIPTHHFQGCQTEMPGWRSTISKLFNQQKRKSKRKENAFRTNNCFKSPLTNRFLIKNKSQRKKI